MKMCVNTQTPLIQFKGPKQGLPAGLKPTAEPLDMSTLTEGPDFELTPGGVTKMVYPLLTRMMKSGMLEGADWVSLNPNAPPQVQLDGIRFHHVSPSRERTSGYGAAKETIWRAFHGIGEPVEAEALWEDEFVDYTYYNRVSAELIRKLDASEDFDLFYIHDFQQLPMGQMLEVLKPKILRWHIPFQQSNIPPDWKEYLSAYLNSYDAVVVSCRRYLEAVNALGYRGKQFYVYPYIDEAAYTKPTQEDIDELKAQLDLQASEKVILMVARMDPMKGHDAAIKAMPRLLNDVPDTKLVLVGNGSFSSSKQGLGLSKAEKWRNEVRKLARMLHVQDNVVFAGHLSQRLLNAAYETCNATVLPSREEGFGLVVVESWLYKKPAIVSSKAGIVELVENGKNGFLIDPDAPADIAEKMSIVLRDRKLAETLGRNGFVTSRKCLIDQGLQAEWEIIRNLG